jgi:prepilin-type N-terminal cleavage/methylation domain-containing protein
MKLTHFQTSHRPDAGFSLVESLVALVLMLVVTGAAFSLVNPSTGTTQTQPEAMDMQQRARIGSTCSRATCSWRAQVYAGPSPVR